MLSTIVAVVAVVAAYVFSRLRFHGKRPLFAAVMFGQTFPWIILVTPLFILFARLGLLNNYLGMIFVYVLGQHSVFDLSARRLSRSGGLAAGAVKQ